jgi:hypothetical protein
MESEPEAGYYQKPGVKVLAVCVGSSGLASPKK